MCDMCKDNPKQEYGCWVCNPGDHSEEKLKEFHRLRARWTNKLNADPFTSDNGAFHTDANGTHFTSFD